MTLPHYVRVCVRDVACALLVCTYARKRGHSGAYESVRARAGHGSLRAAYGRSERERGRGMQFNAATREIKRERSQVKPTACVEASSM